MKFPPLLAMSLTAVPLPVVRRATRLMFAVVMKAHPGTSDRLEAHSEKRCLFMPADLPFSFLAVGAKRTIEVVQRMIRPMMDAPLFLLPAVLKARIEPENTLDALHALYPHAPFSNGFHHDRRGAAWMARTGNAANGASL